MLCSNLVQQLCTHVILRKCFTQTDERKGSRFWMWDWMQTKKSDSCPHVSIQISFLPFWPFSDVEIVDVLLNLISYLLSAAILWFCLVCQQFKCSSGGVRYLLFSWTVLDSCATAAIVYKHYEKQLQAHLQHFLFVELRPLKIENNTFENKRLVCNLQRCVFEGYVFAD